MLAIIPKRPRRSRWRSVDDIRRVCPGRRGIKKKEKHGDTQADGRSSEATRKPQRTIMTRREDAESERHKREDAVEEKLARGNCRGVSSHLIIIINSRVVRVVLIVVVVAVEGPRDHPLELPTPIPLVFVYIGRRSAASSSKGLVETMTSLNEMFCNGLTTRIMIEHSILNYIKYHDRQTHGSSLTISYFYYF